MKLKELKQLIKSGDPEMDIEELLQPKVITEKVFITEDIPTEIPIQSNCAIVKHSTNLGDIIAAMICLRKYHEITGRKIIFAQVIDQKAAYYQGAVHPTKDAAGNDVCINQNMYEMVKPLVESQEYIEKMEPYMGQSIHLDFDVIRGKVFVNLPNGSIQSWLMYAFPDLASDISKPWIFLDEQKRQIEEVTKNKVVLNFTERYRNPKPILDYYFLQKYAPDLIFSGTEREHFLFCTRWQLNIPRLELTNFLDLAYALRSARFLLCNQSMHWNLAIAIGSPTLLEVCEYAQNCLPFYGEKNVGFLHQAGLEYWFRRMYNETLPK